MTYFNWLKNITKLKPNNPQITHYIYVAEKAEEKHNVIISHLTSELWLGTCSALIMTTSHWIVKSPGLQVLLLCWRYHHNYLKFLIS